MANLISLQVTCNCIILVLLLLPFTVLCGTDVRISCYKCKSRNFTDRSCHDPFIEQNHKLDKTCHVPMGSSKIMVPANFCIKVVGTSVTTGEKFIIRDCVLDRPEEDECISVQFEGDIIKRCTLTCYSDGCNSTTHLKAKTYNLLIIAFIIKLFFCSI